MPYLHTVDAQSTGPAAGPRGGCPTSTDDGVARGPRAARAVRAALAPLANVTGGAPPFVVVEHERELAARLRLLASSAAALDGLQAEAAAWWERAKAHYADRVARAVCPAAAGEGR